MDLITSKGRGRHGLRVTPHCRGAASSMLRVSHAATSAFGGLSRVGAVAHRLQSLAMLPLCSQQGREPSTELASTAWPQPRPARPLFTRLWPSASFGHEALWQDTLVAVD